MLRERIMIDSMKNRKLIVQIQVCRDEHKSEDNHPKAFCINTYSKEDLSFRTDALVYIPNGA